MRSEPPVSRAGCQGRSSIGRSTLTAGQRCPTCTTIARAIQLASRPGEEESSPGAPSSLAYLHTLWVVDIPRRVKRLVLDVTCRP